MFRSVVVRVAHHRLESIALDDGHASSARQPLDRFERPVDFVGGVVVDEPDPQHAAGVGLAQASMSPVA